MTRKFQRFIVFVIAAVSFAAVIIFLSKLTYITPHVDTGNYIDRSGITEPVLKIGKYYRDGNRESCYIEVLEDNMIVLGGDEDEIYELIKSSYPDYDKCEGEELEALEELIDNDIFLLTSPRSYTVRTEIYPAGNITSIHIKGTDKNGDFAGISMEYKDPETLNFISCDFIIRGSL